jgi:hypothetical protein
MMSCGSVFINTVMKINTGEAKRFARTVLNDFETGDYRKFSVSEKFKTYLKSDEGQAYFEKVREENGTLKNIKLKNITGATSDTMNYRFIGTFSDTEIEKEIRIQTFQDSRFIDVFVSPWQDTMQPLKK